MTALVNDALALLDALEIEAIQASGGKAAEAVALLALVAGQDVEPAEDSNGADGRWRIARRTAPDRVISTVDPQTRHAHKTRERRQDGFKAHIVIEPDTGLTTAVRVTKAPARRTPTLPSAPTWSARTSRSPTMQKTWRSWPAPPTAPATCCTRCTPRAGNRSSNRGRFAPRSRAGSPSMTSPTTSMPRP